VTTDLAILGIYLAASSDINEDFYLFQAIRAGQVITIHFEIGSKDIAGR